MKNFISEKLRSGETVYGVWSIIPSPILSEIIALSKIDFQILDLEHGSYDFPSLENSIRTSEALGCSPLVRIAGLDPFATQKALDFGAHGIIYPQVEGAADSQKAVRLTKYPPVGVRGYNPSTRVDRYSMPSTEGTRNVNDFSLTGVIVENKASARELDEILKIERLEIVYLGSYDMSVALGKPGDMENPELKSFMKESIQAIKKAGKIAGVMTRNPDQAASYEDLGAKMIVMGVDSSLIGHALRETKEKFKRR